VEEVVDALTGGAIWGIGFGVALGVVRAAGAGVRPVTKAAVRTTIGFTDWMRQATAEARESLDDIYHEARAEREARRKASDEVRT
jgi:Protein of unknown function (DUF5132)